MVLQQMARVPFSGAVQRKGPPLIPHTLAFPAAITSLQVLVGLPHDLSFINAHGMQWRSDHDYTLYSALSGEGFRFHFDTAEYLRFLLPDGTKPLADCFLAAGIPADFYAVRESPGIQGVWEDAAQLRRMVCQNLAAGLPVLLLGAGPQERVLLATGYEACGEVLVAWTFSPGADITNKSFAPQDCQYLTGWEQGTDCAALVTGAPTSTVNMPQLLLRAIERGARFLAAQNGAPGSSKSFYDSWQHRLLDEALWSGSLQDAPGITPDIWDLAERRCYLSDFFHTVAKHLPGFYPEPPAIACDKIHSEMWRIYHLCADKSAGGPGTRGTRRKICEILENCRALDLETAGYLNAFLQTRSRAESPCA